MPRLQKKVSSETVVPVADAKGSVGSALAHELNRLAQKDPTLVGFRFAPVQLVYLNRQLSDVPNLEELGALAQKSPCVVYANRDLVEATRHVIPSTSQGIVAFSPDRKPEEIGGADIKVAAKVILARIKGSPLDMRLEAVMEREGKILQGGDPEIKIEPAATPAEKVGQLKNLLGSRYHTAHGQSYNLRSYQKDPTERATASLIREAQQKILKMCGIDGIQDEASGRLVAAVRVVFGEDSRRAWEELTALTAPIEDKSDVIGKQTEVICRGD